jgi:hypothetical protein
MAFHCGNQDLIPNLAPGVWDNLQVHSQGRFTLRFLSLYNVVLTTCFGCTYFFLLSIQMNPSGKVLLITIDIPKNLHVPFISRNLNDIPAWNWKVNEYIVIASFFLLKRNGLWWGCLVISLEWLHSSKGGQILFGELWLPNLNEVGCGEFITTHEQ